MHGGCVCRHTFWFTPLMLLSLSSVPSFSISNIIPLNPILCNFKNSSLILLGTFASAKPHFSEYFQKVVFGHQSLLMTSLKSFSLISSDKFPTYNVSSSSWPGIICFWIPKLCCLCWWELWFFWDCCGSCCRCFWCCCWWWWWYFWCCRCLLLFWVVLTKD